MAISIPHEWYPRPYQEPIMAYFDGGGKRAVWIVHRRAGKDSTMLNQAAKMALQRVGTFWHMLPNQRQGRKVVWEGIDSKGRRMIDQAFPPEIRVSENNTEMLIRLVNGSVFQVVGSDNYDSLMGANPIHVTISEWPLCKPSSWDFIRPILAENGGTCAFIYTPRRKNHGATLKNIAQGNSAWFYQLRTVADTGALPLSVIDEERASGMPESLVQQEYFCDFNAANVGSFYADLLDKLEGLGGVTDFDYGLDGVYTHWDIGYTDSTAIWFWRFRPEDGGIDVIDCHESHGMQVNYYVEALQRKPYKYAGHFLPHDGNDSRFKFATGMTIKEQIRSVLPNVKVTPKLSVEDGIQAVRSLLCQDVRIHRKNCAGGLAALEHYSREYDEDSKTYSKHPDHDWSSHYADAMRYLAISARAIKALSQPPHDAPRRKSGHLGGAQVGYIDVVDFSLL